MDSSLLNSIGVWSTNQVCKDLTTGQSAALSTERSGDICVLYVNIAGRNGIVFLPAGLCNDFGQEARQ